MKHFGYLLFACLFTCSTYAQQADFNITEVSNLPYSNILNDVWGYVDQNGTEYAVVGTQRETSVVSLADPVNPVEIHRVQGTTSIWRDMKTFGSYIYSVADEGSDGLLIIDMSDLDNIRDTFITTLTLDGSSYTLRKCHNIFMENGYLYLSGSNLNNGGVTVIDLNVNPWSPALAGFSGSRYSHDCMVRNDTIYSADINNGIFTIYDATDKTNIVELVTQSTTGNFTHNCWVSDDGNYLYTTDEKSNRNVDAYDISDLENIERLDFYRPAATFNNGVIPHNTHFHNGYLVTSWYRDGVKILNVNQPDIMVEVGSFDSYAGGGNGFDGNWGAYPYLPSGLVLISDMQSGLFVLDVDYQSASYVRGTVKNMASMRPINGADITIESPFPNGEVSDAVGRFGVGVFAEGSHTINFSHPLYYDTFATVSLTHDSTFIIDMVMRQRYVFDDITGNIVDEQGSPIQGANIALESKIYSTDFNSFSDGAFSNIIPDTTYVISIGKWGYVDTVFQVSGPGYLGDIVLKTGYVDRFNADQGWIVNSTASLGIFERAVPEGTIVDGFIGNPFMDSDDLGDKCFITGASAGFSPYDFDVDNGFTSILSPSISWPEDSDSVTISFSTWFTNYDISDPTNDNIQAVVLLPNQSLISLIFREDTSSVWQPTSVTLSRQDFLGFDNFNVAYLIADEAPGNLTEGGVDDFSMSFNQLSGSYYPDKSKQIAVFPNPAEDYILLTPFELTEDKVNLNIYNAQGKLVLSSIIDNQKRNRVDVSMLASGLHIIQVFDQNGYINTGRFVKTNL